MKSGDVRVKNDILTTRGERERRFHRIEFGDSNAGSEVDTENTGSDVDGKENVCDGDGIENGGGIGGIGEVIVKFYE
ncbi:hypothetical protein Tco_0064457 [Tanacetum coccineum]